MAAINFSSKYFSCIIPSKEENGAETWGDRYLCKCTLKLTINEPLSGIFTFINSEHPLYRIAVKLNEQRHLALPSKYTYYLVCLVQPRTFSRTIVNYVCYNVIARSFFFFSNEYISLGNANCWNKEFIFHLPNSYSAMDEFLYMKTQRTRFFPLSAPVIPWDLSIIWI